MMKQMRGLGKGFFILSALLLMFAVVGCDDSDSTDRIGGDVDEEAVAAGVNTETFNNVDTNDILRVDDIDGDADATFRARVAAADGNEDVTIQTGDYDTAYDDDFDEEFDEGAGAGNRWQVAGFARIDTSGPIDLDDISLTMPGHAVVGGRTLSDWVTSTSEPTVRVYDASTDTWDEINSTNYTLTQNADGTVTVTYNGPDLPFDDGDIIAVMDPVDDVDVDLDASDPDDNCDVIITADVEDGTLDVADFWTVSPRSWGDVTVLDNDSIRLNGVVSGTDARQEVHVRANVFYGANDAQTVERIFSIRCVTGSGGFTF